MIKALQVSLVGILFILFAASTIAVLTIPFWWVPIYPGYTHRYRLAIEMERDAQRFAGSGVIEVTWQSQPWPFAGWRCDVRGEAIPVGLGNSRVFALIAPTRTNVWRGLPCTIALGAYGLGGQSHDTLSALSKKRGVVTLKPEDYPPFAIVADDSAAGKFVEVRPGDMPSRIGTTLLDVELELTEKPITRGVITKIPAVQDLIKVGKEQRFIKSSPTEFIPNSHHFTR